MYESNGKLHTGIVKYGDCITIKVATRNYVGKTLEFKIYEDINWAKDPKKDETIKIPIDKQGKGETKFTIPKTWEPDHKDACTARYFYLEHNGDDFPRSFYIKTKGKEENEVESKPRVRALMLKVSTTLELDEKLEANNAVVLGEELKLIQNKDEEVICECEPRVRAYMRMLRVGEGTEGEIGYTKLFGGENFTKAPHNKDMLDHPQIKVYWYTKKDGTKVYSSAAGAYQVMGYTWGDNNMKIQRKIHGIKDFSQENQDLFCIILFKYARKGMLKLIVAGEIEKATEKYGSYEWASLPPGRYGQPNKTMAKALELYEKFLEEELVEKSDLHLKKGFLSKFGVSCKCKKLKKGEICPDCKKEHIDLSDKIKWQTQFDPKWGNKKKQNVACKKTCDDILIKSGLSATSKVNLYQTALENAAHTKIEINTKISKESINYINNQLSQGHPVQVGVDHKLGYGYNEGTTDHFVVIIGTGCENGNIFYRFYDVGTSHKNKGASENNKLYLNTTSYSLKGKTVYNNSNYIVTQVRKN